MLWHVPSGLHALPLLMLAVCLPAASQTYRCTGSDGKVVYGDQPCKESGKSSAHGKVRDRSASMPAGERLLALAGAGFAKADKQAAVAAIQAAYARLGMPLAGAGPYASVPSARFEKAPAYDERDELDHAILVVKGAAKIGIMSNAVLIADGDVHVSAIARSIVVARGSITIGHETNALVGGQDASGVYLTKGSLELSSCTRPNFYAVAGAVAPCSGTAHNTEVKRGAATYIGAISKMGGAPLFLGEPVRQSRSAGVTVMNSGESMEFTGSRCSNPPDVVSLHTSMLPAARKQGNCPRIDRAFVRCESGARGEPQEKWTFVMCGRAVTLYSSADAPGVPATIRSGPGSEGASHRSNSIKNEAQVEREQSLVGCKKIVTRAIRGKDDASSGLFQVCADKD